MRTDRIALALLGLGVLCGCSSESDSAAASTEVKQAPTAKMGVGDNVDQSGAQRISDPNQVEKGGSYKLVPPDPNDPRYKADPNIGGGG
jgi:hypothetical protein